MGACLTFTDALPVPAGTSLRLRYGLYVHRGLPALPAIERRWESFAAEKPGDLPNHRK